jgi:hypothetical protein
VSVHPRSRSPSRQDLTKQRQNCDVWDGDHRLNPPPETVSTAFDLRCLDLHAAGLDSVDAHCANSPEKSVALCL